MKKLLVLTLLFPALAGCASPLSFREQGFVTGTAIGGGTGYLLGWKLGHPWEGAAIGAGIGALTGTLIGNAIDGSRQAVGAGPAGGAPISPAPPQVPVSPPVPGILVPGSYTGDPTAGTFVNATPWLLSIVVDGPPAGVSFSLVPGQSQPAHLDLGSHRVLAEGWVSTALGPRLVGRYDRTLRVDPRAAGWGLRFEPYHFR